MEQGKSKGERGKKKVGFCEIEKSFTVNALSESSKVLLLTQPSNLSDKTSQL